MVRDLNLNAMAHFEAVARLGGITPAAEELRVSPSAVSQQIRALEADLGVRLLKREKRRVSLTIDGERLFQTTHDALEQIKKVRSSIVYQRGSYGLSIRVSPSFGVRWLAPRLAEFANGHPDWTLRIDATPNFSEFITEKIDLDLRYGQGTWAGLHSECVVHDLILPMCSPAYLETLEAKFPTAAARLQGARLIDSVKAYFRWPQWLRMNGYEPPTGGFPYRFDRSSMAVQMAKDGAGVILESTALAYEELKTGDLVPMMKQHPALEFRAYWLVCPPRHLNMRAVREFSDWVRSAGSRDCQRERDLLQTLGIAIEPVADFAMPSAKPSDET